MSEYARTKSIFFYWLIKTVATDCAIQDVLLIGEMVMALSIVFLKLTDAPIAPEYITVYMTAPGESPIIL